MYDRLGDIYAGAVLAAISDPHKQEVVYEDMCVLSEAFSTSYVFRDFLYKSNLKSFQIVDIICKSFDLDESTKRVLKYIALKRRLPSLRKIIQSYIFLYEEKNNIQRVSIATAAPLSEKQEKEIQKCFEGYLKSKKVRLEKKVDSRLIGGIKLIVNNQVYDNSVSHYLDDLRLAVGKKV